MYLLLTLYETITMAPFENLTYTQMRINVYTYDIASI